MGKKKNKDNEMVVNLDFPRSQFRLVKQMDHMTMKRLLENVYMQGYVEAVEKTVEKTKDAKEEIRPDKIISDISSIKGIGEKKLAEIAKILNGYLTGGTEVESNI